jgi:DNA replicative helicase MCM subunit Mcm2 (Cdc46/Mcm family)
VVAYLFYPMQVYYTCRKCDHEIEVDVTIGEEDDLPETCPECNAVIPDKAHAEVDETAQEKARDRAEDYR